MVKYTLKAGQKPSEETLKRLAELRDEDIVYDEDCPPLSPDMISFLKELDKGIDDMEAGRVLSHEETMKRVKQQYLDYVSRTKGQND